MNSDDDEFLLATLDRKIISKDIIRFPREKERRQKLSDYI
jgi:hypothetical protein